MPSIEKKYIDYYKRVLEERHEANIHKLLIFPTVRKLGINSFF